MRSLALAEMLAENGNRCYFICAEFEGHLGKEIQRRQFDLFLIPAAPWLEVGADVEQVGLEQDAAHTAAVLGKEACDWLVVDQYAMDYQWERLLGKTAEHILVIDDRARNRHECTLLLDQNYFGNTARDRYQQLVPEFCQLLTGPQFALMNREFRNDTSAHKRSYTAIQSILVYMGGSDSGNETARIIRILGESEFSGLNVDVVIGVNHPDRRSLESYAADFDHIKLHNSLPSLRELMQKADLMIGAGGITNWERMRLGLPAILISIADNQMPVNDALHEDDYVTHLGLSRDISDDDLRQVLKKGIASPNRLFQQGKKSMGLVDGAGVKRVIEAMLAYTGHESATTH